jgi:hypothetical protein
MAKTVEIVVTDATGGIGNWQNGKTYVILTPREADEKGDWDTRRVSDPDFHSDIRSDGPQYKKYVWTRPQKILELKIIWPNYPEETVLTLEDVKEIRSGDSAGTGTVILGQKKFRVAWAIHGYGNPMQKQPVKDTPLPDDTQSVKSSDEQEPLPLEAGKFAELNFNSLPVMFANAGIQSDRPISARRPENAKKFKISGYQGSSKGNEPEIDALDWDKGEIIEIKPHSLYADGLRQAEGYVMIMNKLNKLPDQKDAEGKIKQRSWKPVCITYDGVAMRALWDLVRPKDPKKKN